MVKYICERCDKIFDHKGNYQSHLNKKNPCKYTNIQKGTLRYIDRPDQHNDLISYECKYCKKQFTTNSSMNRHIRLFCREKKEEEKIEFLAAKFQKISQMFELMEKQNKTFVKQNNKLLKKIEKLEKNPKKITINKNDNCNNSIINNIQLNNYGKENIDYLKTSEFIRKIKKKANLLGLLEFENQKYCHPEHQENWNIGVTNLKHDTCKVYENNEWVTRKTSEVAYNNFMRCACNLQECVELVALEEGREPDENGNYLDEQEQAMLDSYDKSTCVDVKDNFFVKKLKEAVDKHMKCLYDHTSKNKEFFTAKWSQKPKI